MRRGRARRAPHRLRTQGSCRSACCVPPRPAPALLTDAVPNAQLDGIEFGNPVMMQRQKWADDMAMDRSRLPSDAHGVGIYSSHWNDNNGFTWQGNAALIAQDDALRAAVA